jgi:hypothetical protein
MCRPNIIVPVSLAEQSVRREHHTLHDDLPHRFLLIECFVDYLPKNANQVIYRPGYDGVRKEYQYPFLQYSIRHVRGL